MQARAARPPRAARRCARCEPVKCWSRLPNCVGRDDAQVDAACRVRARRARPPRRARADATRSRSSSAKALGQRARVGRGGDDVEVLDAVGHAARRAGQLDPVRRRMRAQRRDDRARRRRARGASSDARPRRARRRGGLEGGEQVLLGLRAEALAASRSRSRLGRLAQRLERVDAELVVEPARALGPEAGQPRDRRSGPAGTSRAASPPPGSSPVLEQRAGSSPQASCRCPAARSTRPARVSAATEIGRSRTPWPRCGRRRRGARSRRRARRGRRARRAASAMSALVGSAMAGTDVEYAPLMERHPPWLILPTFNEAENLEAVVPGRRACWAAAPGGLPHPDRRRQVARRDRRAGRPAGRRAPRGRGAAPPAARGARPGLPGRLRRALEGGAG